MTVNVHLSGEGIEFEREVTESAALQIMELSMNNGTELDNALEGDEEGAGGLPSNFFRRLSDKQEALIRVLLDADEKLTSTELQRRMEEEYEETVGGGRGIAGILQGFTKKYGDDFEIVRIDWGDGEGHYYLNPNRPEFIQALKEHYEE